MFKFVTAALMVLGLGSFAFAQEGGMEGEGSSTPGHEQEMGDAKKADAKKAMKAKKAPTSAKPTKKNMKETPAEEHSGH